MGLADPQQHVLLVGITGSISIVGILLVKKARTEVVLQGKLPPEKGKLMLRFSNLLFKLPAMLTARRRELCLHMLLFNFAPVLITH